MCLSDGQKFDDNHLSPGMKPTGRTILQEVSLEDQVLYLRTPERLVQVCTGPNVLLKSSCALL